MGLGYATCCLNRYMLELNSTKKSNYRSKTIYLFLMVLLSSLVPLISFGQVTISQQDFEASPASPIMTFTNNGGTVGKIVPGFPSGATTAFSDAKGYYVINNTATFTSNTDIDTRCYSSPSLSFKLAALDNSSGRGLDVTDVVTIAISTDSGTTFTNEMKVTGYNSAIWSYTSGTGTASSAYDGNGTVEGAKSWSPAGGGARTTDGYSTVTLTGLPNTASLRIKITLKNNSGNEVWAIDNVVLSNAVVATTQPSAPATIGASRCGTGSVSLSASGAGVGQDYKWYSALTGGTLLQTGGVTYVTPTITSTTTYYVVIYNTTVSTCESSPRTAAIATVNALLAAPTITAGGPTNFCSGGSVTLTSSTGTSYLWSTGETTASISPTVSGSYTVQIANASGCQSAVSLATVVTVNEAPTTTGVSVCAGNSGSLTATQACGSATPATDGPNNAGNGTTVGTGTAWTNPGNITTAGSPYATVGLTNSSNSQILRASNFGFNIPANATINGVVVTINKMVNNTSGTRADVIVQLYNASNTLVGDNKAITGTNWPASLSNVIYGGPGDTWNAGLTATDINSPNFGVAQSAQCSSGTIRTFTIDYIQISVTYTIPATVDWYTASSGGTKIGSGSPFNPVGVPNSGLPDTNTSGITTYYAACSNNPVCRTPTDFVINTVPSPPIIDTITQPDCTLATGSVILSGLPSSGTWTLTRNGTSTATTSGTGTSTTILGLSAGTYTFAVSNGTCFSGTSGNVVMIAPTTNTWNGSSWSTGLPPNSTQKIVFTGNYPPAPDPNIDIVGCSCKVSGGATVTIKSGRTITITNEVTVVGSGALIFENDASLVQISDADLNSGTITYMRKTASVLTSDYTYWSSPVANQQLNISPSYTSGTFYSYDDFAIPEDWKQETGTTVMLIGKGYIIRGPQNNLPPAFYDVSFVGVPNNGIKTISIGPTGTSNLIGNPYPSAIDADLFLAANNAVLEGTIYFWTHNTPIQIATNITNGTAGAGAYAYTSDDYASYNTTGGVGTGNFVNGVEQTANRPNGYIASGQGFFTTSTSVGGTVTFTNAMRVAGTSGKNSQFFKTKNPKTKTAIAVEKNRIWLDLKNSQGAFKQTLVGYITDATNEYDSRFDGESFDGNEFVDFYSVNQDKNLTIQGRALPFDDTDEVPLGFKSTIDGAFTINIDQVDGSLTNQAVFIEDKLTNTIFDLKRGDYTFTTVAGTFNDRFVLKYTNKTLATKNFESSENKVLVSNKDKQIKINSFAEIIDKVTVYDFLGRQVYQKANVNSNEFSISNLTSNHQTLIVKTVLQNGEAVTDKIIY